MNETHRIRGVVLDWAGTMIDHGSRAPTRVVMEVFDQQGVSITPAQARGPMGMAKRDHIATITRMEDVASKWQEVHGRAAEESDVDRMYHDFLPLQKKVLAEHCDLIPGSIDTFHWCQDSQIHVGSSTGYTRELMQLVVPLARAAGYDPEVVLCAEDAPMGRPAPWMIFECAKRFNVFPLTRMVKVDDTLVGIEAGLNAGCWTVGVTQTGNLVGLSESEFMELSKDDQHDRIQEAQQQMLDAGAHFVIDSVGDLPSIIREIDRRLAEGLGVPARAS